MPCARPQRTVDHAAVLELLKEGLPPTAVAERLSMTQGHVTDLLNHYRPDSEALRARRAASKAAATAVARENLIALNATKVPMWVRRADLVSDFVDHARLFGEFSAARHCRGLLAEMRAFA
ncbi:hypothetical protein C0214_19445 [Methylobacterium sp. DM1]|nr:hypothetical protein C0214_19445 [Methylobacterium sp. DM1]